MKKLMSAKAERIEDFGKWNKKKGKEKLATMSGDGVTQAQDMNVDIIPRFKLLDLTFSPLHHKNVGLCIIRLSNLLLLLCNLHL
jgi:hypothetical protein